MRDVAPSVSAFFSRRSLLLGLSGLMAAPTAAADIAAIRNPQGPAPSSAPSDDFFRSMIVRRYAAADGRDATTYGALVANEFVHISDGGRRRRKRDLSEWVNTYGGRGITVTVPFIAVQMLAENVALVDAEVVEHMGGAELSRLRETNTLILREGKWLFASHQDTVILGKLANVSVPQVVLDAYAGRYRADSGALDIITAGNGVLFGHSTENEVPTRLIMLSEDSFAIPDDLAIAYFSRDTSGKVKRLTWRTADGKVTVAKRTG